MPKRLREDAEPLDASDIRKILLSSNNRRLKAYLLVLASSGARATEALAIRNKDIDFTSSPAKIHIRKEYAKTRVARDVYISNEASDYLQNEWLKWKYTPRRGKTILEEMPDDFVFSALNRRNPEKMYKSMLYEFGKVLKSASLDDRKEDGSRRKIGLHSFRRYVKTVSATQTNTDYSEWLLGHQKSPYWTMKEAQKREIYATKIEKYLTFLNFEQVELTGKNIEAKLEEKDREIAYLRQKDTTKEDAISQLSDQLMKLTKEVQELKDTKN